MRLFLLITGVIVVLIVLGFVFWGVGATRALDEAIAVADSKYGIESLTTDYPSRIASTKSAWDLDEAVQSLGFPVMPRGEREFKETEAAAAWGNVKGEVSDYMSILRTSEVDSPPEIPARVLEFLTVHTASLDAIESILLGDEEIRFSSRLDQGPTAPLPNLLGQINLTKVLVTRAMAAEAGGDSERAWRTLEAAWRLDRVLDDQPMLICRLISIADLKMIAAAARRLEPPLPEWFDELAGANPREDMKEGFRAEMFFLASLRDRLPTEDLTGGGGGAAVDLVRQPVLRTLLRWDAAYTLSDMAHFVGEATTTDPCAFDPNSASGAMVERPWWTGPSVLAPNLASAFARANQAALDLEGTEAVLAVKANPELTGIASDVCAGESWTVERLDDGSARVDFSGAIQPGSGQAEGSVLTTTYVVAPRRH